MGLTKQQWTLELEKSKAVKMVYSLVNWNNWDDWMNSVNWMDLVNWEYYERTHQALGTGHGHMRCFPCQRVSLDTVSPSSYCSSHRYQVTVGWYFLQAKVNVLWRSAIKAWRPNKSYHKEDISTEYTNLWAQRWEFNGHRFYDFWKDKRNQRKKLSEELRRYARQMFNLIDIWH